MSHSLFCLYVSFSLVPTILPFMGFVFHRLSFSFLILLVTYCNRYLLDAWWFSLLDWCFSTFECFIFNSLAFACLKNLCFLCFIHIIWIVVSEWENRLNIILVNLCFLDVLFAQFGLWCMNEKIVWMLFWY